MPAQKPIVLIVDDEAIVREPIAACLATAGYDTLIASGGRQAQELLRSRRPDLILLDLRMPDVSGLDVLVSLRKESGGEGTPVILLTTEADLIELRKAALLGVKDCVLKRQFSLKGLLDRVARCLAARQAVVVAKEKPPVTPAAGSAGGPAVSEPPPRSRTEAAVPPAAGPPETLTRLLSREECLKRAESALQAKALSGVAAQVIGTAGSPRGDLSELVSMISRDPVLSARVLQAANSAAYASNRGSVTTIADAVRNIGCATVRNIAAAVGIYDAMPEGLAGGFNPIRYWQHSFAVATLCERLAPEGQDKGIAYLAGLCHDLGGILFQTHFGPEWHRVQEARSRTGLPPENIERQMLGMTYAELVSVITRLLGLPESIRKPIDAFHASLGGRSEAGSGPLPALLRLAKLYANGLLLASSPQSVVGTLSRAECRRATGKEDQPCPDADALRNEVFTLTGLLARLSSRQDMELMKPLLPRREVRVWLARDPAFSPFDPLACALGSLAEVQVAERLPGEDLGGCDRLVIAGRSVTAPGWSAQDVGRAAQALGPGRVLWLSPRAETGTAEFPSPVAMPVPLSILANFVNGA